jgi:hypothetical protein
MAWFAGFFEGEGAVALLGGRQLRLTISQKDREPLEKCVASVGGTISGPDKRGIFVWYLDGAERVQNTIQAMWPWLSTRRRNQAGAKLARWKARPLKGHRNAAKTHCPKGHPFDEANTYRHGGARWCRACRRERAKKSLPYSSE